MTKREAKALAAIEEAHGLLEAVFDPAVPAAVLDRLRGMHLERDAIAALRARVAELERERDEARAVAVTLIHAYDRDCRPPMDVLETGRKWMASAPTAGKGKP